MLDILLNFINTSRLFNGFSTMCMQIGSRYMMAEIPSNIEKQFNRPFFRRLFIFFIVYLAFRDIKWAVLITLLFILIFNYLLNEKSRVYIGEKLGIKKEEENKEKVITAIELENAKKIIEIYNQNLDNQKIKINSM